MFLWRLNAANFYQGSPVSVLYHTRPQIDFILNHFLPVIKLIFLCKFDCNSVCSFVKWMYTKLKQIRKEDKQNLNIYINKTENIISLPEVKAKQSKINFHLCNQILNLRGIYRGLRKEVELYSEYPNVKITV